MTEERIEPVAELPPASFRRRLSGWLFDIVAVTAVGFAGGAYFVLSTELSDPSPGGDKPSLVAAFAVGWILGGFVYLWIVNSAGFSVGKAIVGIRIVNASGDRPHVGRGFLRTIGSMVSSVPLFLGYLWAAWDNDRQTWHDRFASTHVVKLR